jgi:lipopolysaccharide transport system ATP-binding protein
MALIDFQKVDLIYPIRQNRGMSLKEFLLRQLSGKRPKLISEFKALNDISFTIRDGDRLGIIGGNGAGKSTLLRTIAGVYPIASGTRTVQGDIGALFEITTGFDHESNAYDNIRYRMLMQGSRPKEIAEKTAAIAEFSELGEFLNLPVRTYSSGMQMRLAFSIATAIEPEILIVDEIFGTGDLHFQEKAQKRMNEMVNKAKIVIFVSHNMIQIKDFCNRLFWLDHGKLLADGEPSQIIKQYTDFVHGNPKAA